MISCAVKKQLILGPVIFSFLCFQCFLFLHKLWGCVELLVLGVGCVFFTQNMISVDPLMMIFLQSLCVSETCECFLRLDAQLQTLITYSFRIQIHENCLLKNIPSQKLWPEPFFVLSKEVLSKYCFKAAFIWRKTVLLQYSWLKLISL